MSEPSVIPRRQGLAYDEPLIFERSVPGRRGFSLPPSGVPPTDPEAALPGLLRRAPASLPEVSEPDVVRHFTRLSHWNHAIDLDLYPLGSCTMKHNPRVNEATARLPGFAHAHPYFPAQAITGCLELVHRLEAALGEIAGFPAVSVMPAAGAHGELTGLMMIRAYHRSRGRKPSKILVPESAHGTNPASAALNGFTTVTLPAGPRGILELETVKAALDDDVAGMMVTNPNTLGLFEENIGAIAELLHAHDALLYGDGANMNALLGRARPGDMGVDCLQFNLHKTFSTPHGGGGPGAGPVGVSARLEPFLPMPRVKRTEEGYAVDVDRPQSIGRVRAFWGNFGVLIRAYTYICELGAGGLKHATDMAVLNANYLRVQLRGTYHVPFDRTCMHEVVLDDRTLLPHGVKTMDVAKRLLDYGFHPPTVYFPLVVPGALMIEPTETESRDTLDRFVAAMREIARDAVERPDEVLGAPHRAPVGRLDEARAARKPVLRWRPIEPSSGT